MTKKTPRPKDWFYLIMRALTNVLAVYAFFQATVYGSTATANVLNMTYPIFLAIFAFVIERHRRDYAGYLLSFLAFIGILLVIGPKGLSFGPDASWGLASGMIAAVAIYFLKLARVNNDVDTVLLFYFLLGTLAVYLAFGSEIGIPTRPESGYLFLCALSGIVGQVLLTLGFRYVSPVEGGILGSSRMIMAAFLGPLLVGDPSLTIAAWFGVVLLFFCNVFVTRRKLFVI